MTNTDSKPQRFMMLEIDGRKAEIDSSATVMDGVYLIGDITIGAESNVWYGSILRGDIAPIRIGSRTNIQDGSVVHVASGYPCIVGNGVTVGHRAILHACTVEDGCLIGMGAIVMDGAVVERNSVIGAGAVVGPGMRIPAGSLAVGVPARVKRQLEPQEIEALRASAEGYVGYAETLSRSEVTEKLTTKPQ